MSERIHTLIGTIGEKISQLSEQITVERSKNGEFQDKIDALKEEINSKNDEISALKTELSALPDMDSNNGQDVGSSEIKSISDDQIDELVKEIEYCITQLKK